MICPCCSGASFTFSFRKNSCDLYRCDSCRLIMVWPTPQVVEIYSEKYFKGGHGGVGYVDYDQDKRAMDATFVAFLERIERRTPSKGKLLDVGAATGYLLDLARKRGWDPAGVEVSEWAASEARRKGLDVFTGDLAKCPFKSESFSAVTLFDVFEHATDPRGMLREAHRLLADGGLAAINTPDTSSVVARLLGRYWHLFTPPEHLFYFNVRNLSLLLRDTGFEVVRIERIGKSFTLQYVLQFLGVPSGILAGSRLGRLSLPINLRDNMFILAQKAGMVGRS